MLPQPEKAGDEAATGETSSACDCGGENGFLTLLMLQSREEEEESQSFLYEMELPRDPDAGPARRRETALCGVVITELAVDGESVRVCKGGTGRPRPIAP